MKYLSTSTTTTNLLLHPSKGISCDAILVNYGLAAFGVLLIIVGAFSGSIFVAGFGLLILIPALASGRKRVPPPPRPQRAPARAAPAPLPPRVGDEFKTTEFKMTEADYPTAARYVETPSSSSMAGSNLALFPTAILPTLNLSGTPKVQPAQAPPKEEPRDEFLELIAFVGLMKILSEKR
ncbi:MAG: hypothetical protein OK422_02265 [Thaumarchaeota archaeon]|nr:hypothetical protein [Nitrososphaerota archaeon]